jgi:plasmid stabilization system protein ParE
VKLKFSPKAREDIRAEQAWWKANRPKSPLLLSTELRQAFVLIRSHPNIGKRVRGVGAEGVQRHLLRGTKRYLYYEVQGIEIEVLRLWHAQGKDEPKF